MNFLRRMMIGVGPLLLLPRLAWAQAAPAPEAGTVQIVDGQVRVRSAAGQERQPAVNGKLLQGDTIITGADGELHAEMIDGGVIGVRPNTTMALTRYQANGDKDDGAVFNLIRGGFRSITGWIAKSAPINYKIISATATIGVRGTDHEPHVVEAGSTEGEPGLYDRVHAGGTFIQGPSGRVEVAQGKVGFFSPAARAAPRVLDKLPTFFRGGRHEERFNGLHDRVLRGLENKRTARIMQVREERNQKRGGARPGVGGAGLRRGEGRLEGAGQKRAALGEQVRERREERASHPSELRGNHEGLRRRHERE